MPSECENADPFKELKWNELQDWAGEEATAQGIKYQEEGRITEIMRTLEGNLVAWVGGEVGYFAEVSLKRGKLNSICTCPAGSNCKHGVAVVLEYLERIDLEEEIPVISEGDMLISRVKTGHVGHENFGTYDSDESSLQILRNYLEQLDKQELIDIVVTFAQKYSKLDRYLRDRQNLVSEA